MLAGNLLNFTTMTIKGQNGESYSVTSQGQGTLNTVLSVIGATGALGGGSGGLLGNLFGGGWNNCNSENMAVSRYEAKMQQELAAKDGKIALLESNIYTDQKIADVYERLNNKINANRDEQTAINIEQAVYNGTNTAALGCIRGQIAQLQAMTEMVIPQRRVCDTGCCCGG